MNQQVLQLAHRPQLSSRALYNCIVFLNQLHLYKEVEGAAKSPDAPVPLAVLLVNMYFRMFDVAVNKKSDEKSGTKSRLMSALLTGINRAHPYLPSKDQGLDDHMDALYNVTFAAPAAAATQALMLLFLVAVGEISDKNPDEETKKKHNRFYRAVFAKLSIPSFLSGGKHLTMFFNLLYKTMKNDTDSDRVLAFAKRLICTTFHTGAPVAAASLFLLNEIMKTHRIIAKCLTEMPSSGNAALCLDPSKRDPRSAICKEGEKEAESSEEIPPMWELCLMSNHFHPSVGKFASSLGEITYSGDPLRDFALAPFLDKFSYKNPKAHKKNMPGVAKRRIETSQPQQPVNDPAFLRRRNVGVEDKFFHDFFSARAQRERLTEEGKEEDVEEVEEEEEAFVMLEDRKIDHVVSDALSEVRGVKCCGTLSLTLCLL
jgi:ribosome biogenesis protein MAK21